MNRRHFLTHTAALCLGLVLPIHLQPVPALALSPVTGRLFHLEQGRLLASADGGRNWLPAVNFGPDCRAVDLAQSGDQVYLTLEIPSGYRFRLASTDGRTWRTT